MKFVGRLLPLLIMIFLLLVTGIPLISWFALLFLLVGISLHAGKRMGLWILKRRFSSRQIEFALRWQWLATLALVIPVAALVFVYFEITFILPWPAWVPLFISEARPPGIEVDKVVVFFISSFAATCLLGYWYNFISKKRECETE